MREPQSAEVEVVFYAVAAADLVSTEHVVAVAIAGIDAEVEGFRSTRTGDRVAILGVV